MAVLLRRAVIWHIYRNGDWTGILRALVKGGKNNIMWKECVREWLWGWSIVNRLRQRIRVKKHNNYKCNSPLRNAIKMKSFKECHPFGMVLGRKKK